MPGLSDYQQALAAAVAGEPLADRDRDRLGPISEEGIAMTARVRRSWCRGRAARAAPLTLSALPATRCADLLDAWVDEGGGTSSFFEAEADALLAFIADGLPEVSHAMALCRLEGAVIRARRVADRFVPPAPPGPDALLIRAPAAAMVELTAPVEALLDAVEGHAPWPPVDPGCEVLLVAPGLPGLARPASASERALWDGAAGGVRAGSDLATARALAACGALAVRTAAR